MKRLIYSFVLLIVGLSAFFNIERLGQENVIDVDSFVYPLGMAAVVGILLLPSLGHRMLRAFTLVIVIYIVFKFYYTYTQDGYNIVGGIYTYLTITEVSFLSMLILLSHQVSKHFYEWQQGVGQVLLSQAGSPIPSMDEARRAIRTEVRRSRHYHRPMSVIMVEPTSQSFEVASGRMLARMQQDLLNQYTKVNLAETIRRQLRLMDIVLTRSPGNGLIILCPELKKEDAPVLIEHIRQAASDELGIEVECASASFPDEALTFEALVEEAESRLAILNKTPQLPQSEPVKTAKLPPSTEMA